VSEAAASPSGVPTEILSYIEEKPSTNGKGRYEDTFAEWDDEETIAAIEAALSHIGDVVRLEADTDFPLSLRDAQPDIVFNFAESLGGSSRESYVPTFCEFWGIPYTGSDPLTLGICLDKARTKETLIHHGIPTPEFQVVECPEDVQRTLELPVIVKPLHEGSSKGITQRSFCTTWEETETEVARVVERYREPAITSSRGSWTAASLPWRSSGTTVTGEPYRSWSWTTPRSPAVHSHFTASRPSGCGTARKSRWTSSNVRPGALPSWSTGSKRSPWQRIDVCAAATGPESTYAATTTDRLTSSR
jgi:hypothetical protein